MLSPAGPRGVSGGHRYTHALTIMAITDPTPDRNSPRYIRKHVLRTRLLLVPVPLGDGLVLRRANSLTAKRAVKVSMMLEGFTASARHEERLWRPCLTL